MKSKTIFTRSSPAVAVQCQEPLLMEQAALLAAKFGLPAADGSEKHEFILRLSDRGLELIHAAGASSLCSVRVDFVEGSQGYRRARGGPEKLIRAIGHKKNRTTRVLDATGGLGRDAFIMASHGCQVHVVEKNPVVAVLLENGLQRAAENPETKEACGRIQLTIGDSCQLLADAARTGEYDVIYLDPMFPERSKSALVKKELQMLQVLVGQDDNTDDLFQAALKAAGKKVVVKRPKTAPPLRGREPSHSLSGKTIRFDVYLAG